MSRVINDDFFERLSVLANVLQIENYAMNVEQLSNDDLMKELKLQNQDYLEEILRTQKLILERLDKLEKI